MSDKNKTQDSLSSLKKRIERAKKKEQIKNNPKKKDVDMSGMGLGMRVLSDLVAAVLVSVFIGYQLDTYFDTAPLFILLFLLLGFVAGIFNVIRTAKKFDEEQKNK